MPTNPDIHLVLAAISDATLRVAVLETLPDAGYRVLTASCGSEIGGLVRQHAPDILLMDKDMAESAGEAIRATRLVRVALCDPADRDLRLQALRELGAAACINLPFDCELLVAALDSLMRLLKPSELGDETAFQPRAGDEPGNLWTLSRTTWTLAHGGCEPIRLTQAETTFIATLALSPGEPVSRPSVIAALGHNVDYYDSRRLDTLVSRLRLKVQRECGQSLPVRSIHAVGYAAVSSIVLAD